MLEGDQTKENKNVVESQEPKESEQTEVSPCAFSTACTVLTVTENFPVYFFIVIFTEKVIIQQI